jgi:hypothetical protein
MQPCKFTFDDTPAFDGFAYGSKWNGFDNVAVTPEELKKIIAYFKDSEETVEDLESIKVGDDGLVCLGWGFTTTSVETEA